MPNDASTCNGSYTKLNPSVLDKKCSWSLPYNEVPVEEVILSSGDLLQVYSSLWAIVNTAETAEEPVAPVSKLVEVGHWMEGVIREVGGTTSTVMDPEEYPPWVERIPTVRVYVPGTR
mgnify:CR=1 FL=1